MLHRQYKRQFHKIVKHTPAIRRLLTKNCFSVFDHFVGLALKGLINSSKIDLSFVKTDAS